MVRAWKMIRPARGREPVGSYHHAIFQSTDQLFDGKLRSTTATASHHHADTTPIYIIGTLDSQRLLFVI